VIKVVEEFPCEEKKKLEERELWYINNTENCINKHKPSLLSKKDYQRIYHHNWNIENRDQQKQYHKEKYQKKKQEKISATIIEDNEAN
jgi:hypothetical protein